MRSEDDEELSKETLSDAQKERVDAMKLTPRIYQRLVSSFAPAVYGACAIRATF